MAHFEWIIMKYFLYIYALNFCSAIMIYTGKEKLPITLTHILLTK